MKGIKDPVLSSQIMHLKDYYSLLEISSSATLPEIKKAYRRLALQYHPDKNPNDPYANTLFTELKEAYEVLTDPTKKEYYLQQRWYNQSIGKRKVQVIITPVNILKQVLELDRYVSTLDVHRMDREGLYDYACALIADDTIKTLNEFDETHVNNEIVAGILKIAHLVPVSRSHSLKKRLMLIKAGENEREIIKNKFRNIKKTNRDEKNRIWIVLLIVLLLSLLIFFLSQ